MHKKMLLSYGLWSGTGGGDENFSEVNLYKGIFKNSSVF